MRMPKAYLEASSKSRSKDIVAYHKLRADTNSIEEVLDTKVVENFNQGEEVVDAEKDQSSLLQLDYATWLPFAAKVYRISPKIEDYILVNVPICPSELPNRNGIAFPTSELARFMPPPISRMAYKAWAGTPVHLEHANEVHEDAHGVVLDASFHKVSGYGGGKLWKVMGLLAIDKNKYPDIAQKVLIKEINTYSMGALVDAFTCGFCGVECTSKHCCNHITSIKDVNWKTQKDWDGSQHLVFLNAHGVNPIEVSIVKDPAWAPALSDEVFEFASSAPKP
jgi:hypothetical protein